MNNAFLKNSTLREKILVSVAISLILIFSVYSLVLKFAMNYFSNVNIEKKQMEKILFDLKKDYKKDSTELISKEEAIMFVFNYLGEVTEKSKIKLKNLQVMGTQNAKGILSFQMRFISNADTFNKFLYLSENTIPPLIINNFRISSISGGSFEGMRQIEGLATITVIPRSLSQKIILANLEKYESIQRDPFSPFVRSEVKLKTPVIEETPPQVPNWILTAAMSDEEGDYLIFTKSDDSSKFIVNLKGEEDITFKINNERIEIIVDNNKIEWILGESKSQDSLPKKLIEIIEKKSKETTVYQESPERKEDMKEEKVDDIKEFIPQFDRFLDRLPDDVRRRIREGRGRFRRAGEN